MMNKNLIVFGAASVALATGAFAQEEISVTTTFAWESAYVFRGVQFADETFMPGVDVAYENVYVGIWAAMPAGTEANEVDFYGGYGLDLSDGVALDIGVTHYTFPDSDADIGEDGSTTEIFAGVALDSPISPSFYAYYDFDLKAYTIEGSIGYSFEIDEKSTFDLSGAAGYVDGDGGSYSYVLASAGLGYAFNDYVSGSLYVNYSTSTDDSMHAVFNTTDSSDDELWFGFSVTGGF